MPAAGCEEVWRKEVRVEAVEGAEGAHTEQLVLDSRCIAGDRILILKKTSLVPTPGWDTLQVGEREHARFSGKALKLNHSSSPNTRIEIKQGAHDDIDLVATRKIAVGEPLTFDYRTTEWLMNEPFEDWATKEQVQGFSGAPPAEQRRLLSEGLVAPHIRALSALVTRFGGARPFPSAVEGFDSITAVRDSSHRGSTHHLIFDLGECYVDVVVAEGNGAAAFKTVSADGMGASTAFEGAAMPTELKELAFGELLCEGSTWASRELTGADAVLVRAGVAKLLSQAAPADDNALLEMLTLQRLRLADE